MRIFKIAIVSPYDIFRFGGVQEHILAVRDELESRGHEVFIIAPRTEAADKNKDKHILTLGSATQLNTPLATTAEVAFSATIGEINNLYNEHDFDIVHFHEPWVPVLSRQLLSRSPAKNVATFHAKLPENLVNKSIEKAWLPYGKTLMKYLDALTAVSDAAADYVSTATKKRIQIIPNGIKLSEYDPKKVKPYKKFDDGVPTIFYVGRLEKRKGVDYLLKAYKQLLKNQPGVRLVIAGDGPKKRQLKSYVSRHKLKDVHFLGFISTEEKLSLFKTCGVFCSPALYGESFGIVLIEAMAMGAPIVAGNNDGYAGVLTGRGKLGLVDPYATTAFADRLELLLFDKEVATLASKWGLETVKQYDYKLITDQYLALYRRIAEL